METLLNTFSPALSLSATTASGASLNAGWASFNGVAEQELTEEQTGKSYDDLLIERILAGEYDAFEQLITRHSRRVLAIARKFFRSPETVEDITQETFAKAYFSLNSYRRGASFEYWLARIAVNNCYDELRRRRKRGETHFTDVSEDQAAWLDSKLSGVSLDHHLLEREQECATETAEKLLAQLTPEAQLTLVLLHAEEYSVREVAQMMGWSEAKVKIRAFRARHEMRRALKRLTLTEERKNKGRSSRRTTVTAAATV